MNEPKRIVSPLAKPTRGSSRAERALLHPVWWLALALLLLNDHYLKGSGVLAGVVTGKLSDFAGMLVAPPVLAVALRARTARDYFACHLLVGAGFCALKLSPVTATAWCNLGSAIGWNWRVVSDPTDLVALPLLLLSSRLFGPASVERPVWLGWQRWTKRAGLALGLVSILATSRPPPATPALGPKAVYLPAEDGLLERDRASGRPLRKLACHLGWGRKEVASHVLIESFSGGGLRACDLRRGQPAWRQEVPPKSFLVATDPGHVLMRTDDRVWVLDPSSGRQLWQILGGNRGAALVAGRVLVLSDSGVATHSLEDGSLEVPARRPYPSARPFANLRQPLGVLLAQPRIEHGVDALDAETFTPLWHLEADERYARYEIAPVVVAASDALVFTHHGSVCPNYLAARDARSGRVVWSLPWCPYRAAISVDHDHVLTSDQRSGRGMAELRRASDGQAIWSAPFP